LPEDIGHFKVVIEGEVDKNIGKDLEDNIEKSGKKGAGKLEKQIRTILGSSSFTKFLDKTFDLSKKITGKFEGGDGKTYAKAGAAYQSMTNPEHLQPLTKGAEASGGGSKGLMGIVTKLGILVGAVMMVVGVLQSLAPIQAILKGLSAILQLTLYPIAMVLSAIFKPIMVLLLKYLILPFYYNVMPILVSLGKWLGETIAGILKDPAGAIQGLWGFVVEGTLKILGILWEVITTGFGKWWEGITTGFGNWWEGITTGFGNWWEGITTGFGNWWEGITTGFGNWWEGITTGFGKWWEGITTGFGNWWEGITTGFGNWWEGITTGFGKWWEGITTGFGNWWEVITTGFGNWWEGITTGFGKWWEGITSSLGNLWDEIIVIINRFCATIKTAWESLVNHIIDLMNKIPYINISHTGGSSGGGFQGGLGSTEWGNEGYDPGEYGVSWGPAMAEGGIVTTPRVSLIGERGPEAVIPLSRIGNMGQTVNMTVNFNNTQVTSKSDINDIVAKIEKVFYTNSKRSGVR